ERMRLLMRVSSGAVTMVEACRQAGVSRKTGYKWWARFAAAGVAGLAERSRAPHHRPQMLAPAVREAVLAQRAQHPTWGPRKLIARLRSERPEVA
ncbi:MAG: leucine zipper domain-containing protein, partial [Dehalococcoidia bacterium]